MCPHDGRPTVDEAQLKRREGADPWLGYLLIGKYEVISRLGRGAFGSVYKARHMQTGGHVAVKLLRSDRVEEDDAIRRFYIEAQNTHRLSHANTIRVSDFGQSEDGVLYLIMELIEGTQLAEILKAEGPLGVARTIRVTEQILKSLGEAHSYGIVHRDIKPANIMLVDQFGEKDFVKVLDFGISRAVEGDGAATKGAIGTPKYMSPEQWCHDPERPIDGRADLYSVACMAYEMLAGKPPFVADDTNMSKTVAYMRSHLELEAPLVTDIAPGCCRPPLAALIASLLQKERDKRPPTAEAVLDDLALLRKQGHLAEGVRIPPIPADSGRRSGLPSITMTLDEVVSSSAVVADSSETGLRLDEELAAALRVPPRRSWRSIAAAAALLIGAVAGVALATSWSDEPGAGAALPATASADQADPREAAKPGVRERATELDPVAALPDQPPASGAPEEPAAAPPAAAEKPATTGEVDGPEHEPSRTQPKVEQPPALPAVVPKPAAAPEVKMLVMSEPSGARVVIGETGQSLGTTPVWWVVDQRSRAAMANGQLTLLFVNGLRRANLVVKDAAIVPDGTLSAVLLAPPTPVKPSVGEKVKSNVDSDKTTKPRRKPRRTKSKSHKPRTKKKPGFTL